MKWMVLTHDGISLELVLLLLLLLYLLMMMTMMMMLMLVEMMIWELRSMVQLALE
jgi:hypothetical protein